MCVSASFWLRSTEVVRCLIHHFDVEKRRISIAQKRVHSGDWRARNKTPIFAAVCLTKCENVRSRPFGSAAKSWYVRTRNSQNILCQNNNNNNNRPPPPEISTTAKHTTNYQYLIKCALTDAHAFLTHFPRYRCRRRRRFYKALLDIVRSCVWLPCVIEKRC